MKLRILSFLISFTCASNIVNAMDPLPRYYDVLKTINSEVDLEYSEEFIQGNFYFFYGTMGAGKSKLAIQKINEFRSKGLKTYVYTPKELNCDKISSRANLSADVSKIDLDDIEEKAYLIVDEAQFLSKDEITKIRDLCNTKKVTALCFGLFTTFKLELFEGTKNILACADNLRKIPMICEKCKKNEAVVNFRVNQDEQLKVLDKNQYLSICKDCFNLLRVICI